MATTLSQEIVVILPVKQAETIRSLFNTHFFEEEN